MKGKLLFILTLFSIGFHNLSFGESFETQEKLNKVFYDKKTESEGVKVTIKVVPYLNLIVKKNKDRGVKEIEIKGTAAKDTQVGVEDKKIKIVAICDNYKW